jgi:hypothetical protein
VTWYIHKYSVFILRVYLILHFYGIWYFCNKNWRLVRIYFQSEHNFRTLYIQLSSSTCFGPLWPPSARLNNIIHGKQYQGGGLPSQLVHRNPQILAIIPYSYYTLQQNPQILANSQNFLIMAQSRNMSVKIRCKIIRYHTLYCLMRMLCWTLIYFPSPLPR